jgi:hypothetical protein
MAEGMDTQETLLTGESLLKPFNGINLRTTAPTNSITSDEDEEFVPPAIISQSITDFLLDPAVPSQATEAGRQESTAGPAISSPHGPSVAMETNSMSPESAPKAISTAKKGLTLTSVLKEANRANAAALGTIPKTTHKPWQPLLAASAPLHMSPGNASHGKSDDLPQGEGTAPGGSPSPATSSRGGGTAPGGSPLPSTSSHRGGYATNSRASQSPNRGGPQSLKGIKRPHQPTPSTSRQAYSTAAATLRKHLIHANRERDNLVPFECEEEFCTFRNTVKAAIWARIVQFVVYRDLVIKDWSFRRSHGQTAGNLEGLGIIYCTTEAQQNMVMSLIVLIGLGGHVLETDNGLQGGMSMSFRKPQFGPQNIGDLLEAIFACNGIEGLDCCGSREKRTDTPKVGAPFKVCTITFPEDVVGYAEQRDFRIDGPDGSVYLYVKAVNRRKVDLEEARQATRASEAEAKAKADAEAAEAGTGTAPGAAGQHNNNIYPVNSMMVQAAIKAAYAEGRTVTIPSVPVQPSDIEAEEVMMAPNPEELVALIDIVPGVTSPQRWTPEGFSLLSKGQRQRWIRKLKGFCGHLKAHLPPLAM